MKNPNSVGLEIEAPSTEKAMIAKLLKAARSRKDGLLLPDGLTMKQALFVKLFCHGVPKEDGSLGERLNAQEAMRAAGFKLVGRKKYPLHRINKILRRPKVAEAIRDTLDAEVAAAGLNGNIILRELLRIARADLRSFYEADGTLKPVRDWTPEMSAAVSEITTHTKHKTKGRPTDKSASTKVAKIKLHDKGKALNDLARILTLFNDTLNLKHSGADGGPVGVRMEELVGAMTPEQAAKFYHETVKGE